MKHDITIKTSNLLSIDSTKFLSELCKLGIKYTTDKSPLSTGLHRHAYTPIYNLIFSTIRYKLINIAEIGIYNNMSINCWREFFPNAIIYGLDVDDNFLHNGKSNNLHNTFYEKINVGDKESIIQTFNTINKKFDIIIDDSTHEPHHQINVIENCIDYVNSGGYLIIEDLFKKIDLSFFEPSLTKIQDQIIDYFFIDANHINMWSAEWNNDRLLVIVKK